MWSMCGVGGVSVEGVWGGRGECGGCVGWEG